MKEESKKELVTISIALDPEVIQKLDEGNYNRSKLIDSLLTNYFKKEEQDKIPSPPIPPPDKVLREGQMPTPPKNMY